MDKINNLKMAFIGAGKIAHSLVPAFLNYNLQIDLIVSQRLESAKSLAQKFSINNYSDSLFDNLISCDIIFLSVPDDNICSVKKNLLDLQFDLSGKIIVHLSGSKTSNELSELEKVGASTASLHIMQTFPSKTTVSLENIYAAIETPHEETYNILEKICRLIKLKPFRLSSDQKVLYHLMGTLASNFLVEKFYNIENCAEKMSDDFPNSMDLLKPLYEQTIVNIKSNGAVKSLSGPIERGDLKTVEEHLNAINDNNDFSLSYAAVSLNLINIALSKGSINTDIAEEMRAVLKDKLRELI